MPLTTARTFRVRSYECDAHGHLNNAYYLRYMQETAFDASAAAGYDMERYNLMERHWLIRESNIEFLRPLVYNDRVQVKTWIADFRRMTSRRLYEFRKPGANEPSAQAYTDWVFLDTHSLRPAAIPESLARAFFPEGVPQSFPPRQPFPKAPPPPPDTFKMLQPVAWNDIDSMQHVNNAVYLNYITECGMQALAACGWPWQRLSDLGIGVYLRRMQIKYSQPAMLGDELEITSWISDVRRATAKRHYTIRRAKDDALITQAQSLSVWVDTASGFPVRIPRDMLADLSPSIA
jgi:acyl-CoA thioester hydrolase